VYPNTPATKALEDSGLSVTVVRTEPPCSVEESATLQGIDVDQLIRTIVVRRKRDDYVFVLVPGGREIDWAKLRAVLGVRRLSLPDLAEARRATGYERGAITPFGSSEAWPVIADTAVARRDRVNLHLAPAEMIRHLGATVADVTRS
jgi:prolyl-tRNA editing enzyme YbaK/EbsC (Cys-tRNA(Pro) deacylase)